LEENGVAVLREIIASGAWARASLPSMSLGLSMRVLEVVVETLAMRLG
jgi:hypothetical protein